MLDWKGNLSNCFWNVCFRLCTLTTSMCNYVNVTIFSDVLDCLEHLELWVWLLTSHFHPCQYGGEPERKESDSGQWRGLGRDQNIRFRCSEAQGGDLWRFTKAATTISASSRARESRPSPGSSSWPDTPSPSSSPGGSSTTSTSSCSRSCSSSSASERFCDPAAGLAEAHHPVHWGAQHLRPPCQGGEGRGDEDSGWLLEGQTSETGGELIRINTLLSCHCWVVFYSDSGVIKWLLLLQESFITNAKLTEGEIIKNAKYVETLFKPAVNKEICRWDLKCNDWPHSYLSTFSERVSRAFSPVTSPTPASLSCAGKRCSPSPSVCQKPGLALWPQGGKGSQPHSQRPGSVLHNTSGLLTLSPSLVIVIYSDPNIYYGVSLVTSSFLKPAQYHEVKQGDYLNSFQR